MSRQKFSLSIIVPTYNEYKNIPILVAEIFQTIAPYPHLDVEVIIVDDNSPDGTGAVADEMAKKFPVQVIHRSGKSGLGSAVMAGFERSKRDIVGVMDGDLSHDPAVLPDMISQLTHCDIVIGSRFDPVSEMQGKWPFFRKWTSHIGVFLARRIANVSDPLSGYFFAKRSVVENVTLTSPGYKILFEILVKGKYSRCCEVPFIFRERKFSASKLDLNEYLLFFKQILFLGFKKLIRRTEPSAERYH
jgi:dolichol-phosphate mannosyltransferase